MQKAYMKYSDNDLLDAYLKKRINQPTVILCFRILLEDILISGTSSGMKKSDISKIFNTQNKQFGIQSFKTDYILRQTGIGTESAIIESNDLFYIDPKFLDGLAPKDMEDVIEKIDDRYNKVGEIRRNLYKHIQLAVNLNPRDRGAFIREMLLDKETEKKGQSFEVTAFAILKVLYSIRGFELNRFSTIYSNDGGIDYTSQTAVYQVTTFLNDKKFDEDLLKAPLKRRIFVYKKAAPGFDLTKFDNELVSDYISSEDLINHLEYLLKKKPEVNSGLILEVILNEFKREHYL